MRRMLTLMGGMALTMALLVPAGSATAATTTATRHGHVWSFALVTPNTAVAKSGGMMVAPGDWIKVTGGGTFNPATGAVHAGGAFVHHDADGTVHCRGAWRATALIGWTDFSASRSRARLHGGIVSMLATHYCPTMGEIHVGIPMTVTSTRNAPECSSYVEGVTVGDFTQSTGGKVVIRAPRQHKANGSSIARA